MTAPPGPWRPTRAEIDPGAVRRNVAALLEAVAPAALCAVVKADGYGHGAATAAGAVIEAGASMLAVALVEEAAALRAAGGALADVPILLLSEPPPGAEAAVAELGLTATVYSAGAIDRLAATSPAAGIHLKIDTGMHRVGASPDDAVALARRAGPLLQGVCTHFAVADAPDDPYTRWQIAVFEGALTALRAAGVDPGLVHAANSAGALAFPAARYSMVRCGITLYGLAPDAALDPAAYGVVLRPALRLVSAVSHVKVLPAGERVSYGLRYQLGVDSVIATVPVGYADGVPRRLSAAGAAVLIGGRRRAMAGRVTMDQVLVDCGPADDPASHVALGDEVVLIGRQSGPGGSDEVSAWEWAARLDTIAYEITCGISARVPRVVAECR